MEQQYRTPRRSPPDVVYTPFDVTSGRMDTCFTSYSSNKGVSLRVRFQTNRERKTEIEVRYSNFLVQTKSAVPFSRWKNFTG